MNFPSLEPSSCLKVSIKQRRSNTTNHTLGYFLKVFLVDGLVLFHLVEGEMVGQKCDLSLGDFLVKKGGHPSYDGWKISLHLLVCEEKNVLLLSPAPVPQYMGDEGAVVPRYVRNKGAEENLKSS